MFNVRFQTSPFFLLLVRSSAFNVRCSTFDLNLLPRIPAEAAPPPLSSELARAYPLSLLRGEAAPPLLAACQRIQQRLENEANPG
jgi:hypothetical protein